MIGYAWPSASTRENLSEGGSLYILGWFIISLCLMVLLVNQIYVFTRMARKAKEFFIQRGKAKNDKMIKKEKNLQSSPKILKHMTDAIVPQPKIHHIGNTSQRPKIPITREKFFMS